MIWLGDPSQAHGSRAVSWIPYVSFSRPQNQPPRANFVILSLTSGVSRCQLSISSC